MRAPRTRTLVEGIFGIPQGYLLLGHSPIFPQKPSNKTQGQPRRGVQVLALYLHDTRNPNLQRSLHSSSIYDYSIRRGDAGTDTRGFTSSGSSRSNGDLRSPLRSPSPNIPRTKVQVLELDSRQKFKLTVFIHHTNKANLLCA